MSLTGQIRDLSSPLRRWMETIVDRARAAEAAGVGFDALVERILGLARR